MVTLPKYFQSCRSHVPTRLQMPAGKIVSVPGLQSKTGDFSYRLSRVKRNLNLTEVMKAYLEIKHFAKC